MNKENLRRTVQVGIRDLETAKEFLIGSILINPDDITIEGNDFIIKDKDYFYSFENEELVKYSSENFDVKALQEMNWEQMGKPKRRRR